MTRLLVIGAGGYGRAVAEAAMAMGGHTVVGFVDDRWPDLIPIWNVPVVGRLADLPGLLGIADAVVPAIGNGPARRSACAAALAAGFDLASIVHPRALVSPSAVLGLGVTVMAGAVIGTLARIDDGAIVNTGAVVDHDGHIGAYAHLGVGACMGGGSALAPGAVLRIGATLAPGLRLEVEPRDLAR
jgi:sugar O-acyltransferase (sialic acid O-acetyltransferase NeuD family)